MDSVQSLDYFEKPWRTTITNPKMPEVVKPPPFDIIGSIPEDTLYEISIPDYSIFTLEYISIFECPRHRKFVASI